MLVFAVVHVYWGLGGTAMLPSDFRVTDDTAMTVIAWAAVPLCLAGAAVAFALARPGVLPLPRRLLLAVSWGTAALLFVHALPAIVELVAMAAGLMPREMTERDRFVYFVYEPFWLAGSLLFGAATWRFGQRTHPVRAG
jgi:hypothetical protein